MNKLIKKYETFIKYVFVAGISFLIDIGLFTIFNYLFNTIILSTVLARIISSFINFLLNKEKVFKGGDKLSIIKYYLLVVVQMFVSAFSVKFLCILIPVHPTIIKVPVECILFICNYTIQKLFIFRKKN